MQNEILAAHPAAKLRVFAVWFPVLDGDSEAGWDPIVLNDARVTNFWDPNQGVSTWFGENVVHGPGIVWDHYFLYGSDATWRVTPGPLVGEGGNVIDAADQLRAQVGPLLTTA